MTAIIIDIRNAAIRICPGDDEGVPWLAIAPRGHAWAFSSLADAHREAAWLSKNFDLPIRVLPR
jgi:hypothetical protein